MQNKYRISLIVACLFFIFLSFTLRPVPTPSSEAECHIATGIVTSILESGTKDISFTLEGQDGTYYINRGLEKGLIITELQNNLMGQTVTIKYPKYWTPLDPANHTRHISELEYQEDIIFSEIKN